VAIGLRIVPAIALQRLSQQVFGSENGSGVCLLLAQRAIDGLPADHPERDQVIADPAAETLLPRERSCDITLRCQPLRDQQFTKKHEDFPLRQPNAER
jgi:hypothetical protein